jgi:RNA-directed DNA polymerase
VAPPVERVWMEKDGGKKRPRGTPCFEDKIVQRAVVMIVEAIVESDFHAVSHGFREDVSEVLICYSLGVYESRSNPQPNRVTR